MRFAPSVWRSTPGLPQTLSNSSASKVACCGPCLSFLFGRKGGEGEGVGVDVVGEVGGGEEGVSLSRGRGKVWVWEGCGGLDGGGGGVVCEAGVLGRVGVLGERGSGGG